MRAKTVIFDLDGTLLNTLGDLTGAVNAAMDKKGWPRATEAQVRERVGNGVGKLIERSVPAGTDESAIAQALADFRAAYDAQKLLLTHPYPGVCAMLAALWLKGVRMAVLSNKYDPASKALIAHYFPGFIDLTLGERATVPRKPDPSAVHEILSALDADPASTVYVGDSAVDVQTAHNAGLTAIGVTWGFRSRETLLEAGADMLADSPAELIPLLTGAPASWEAVRAAFTRRGFAFSCFETKAQAADYLARECAGKRVGFGGSVTLDQMGAYEAVGQTADVHWHWRDEPPCQDAQVYVTSANGLSMTGEVVNIDGACNRVAASLWGCETCFVVCGENKLSPSLIAAIERAQQLAAPRNAQRLQRKTPCVLDGKCHDCRSPDRICSALAVVMAPPLKIPRYEIVLIGEDLGY